MTATPENPMKLIHKYRASWPGLLLVCIFSLVGASAFSESKTLPCDCGDIKLEPSKDRIKITRANEVSQLLQAVEKNNLTEIDLLRRSVATADMFLQRHMNGDIYQFQAPDDWRDYNGPIMAMNMEQWEQLEKDMADKDRSQWNLCPSAKMITLLPVPNKTTIQYELVTVGRFLKVPKSDDVFSTAENGRPFVIEVVVNDQAKIVGMKQIPQGYGSYPYGTLRKQLLRKLQRNLYGSETKDDLKKYKASWRKQLADLEQAAKICAASKKVEE